MSVWKCPDCGKLSTKLGAEKTHKCMTDYELIKASKKKVRSVSNAKYYTHIPD